MKIIHSSIMSEPAAGVIRQLEYEALAAKDLGYDWLTRIFTPESIDSEVGVSPNKKPASKLWFKIQYYRWLNKESRNVDVVILRYSFHDPFQLLFAMLCNKPLYFVHHTLEEPELSLNPGFSGKIRLFMEKLLAPTTLFLSAGLIAVTDEIALYEKSRVLLQSKKQTLLYPNGIMFPDTANLSEEKSENEPSSLSDSKNAGNIAAPGSNSTPVFLFVSSVFAPWQGLEDLLLDAKNTPAEFQCHIVGKLTAEQEQYVKSDNRFVYHGYLDSQEIKELIQQSNIGLSALALGKKNMKSACTLKVREYLRDGLAVYAGYEDVFPDNFQYLKNGPIEINQICDYAVQNKLNNRSSVRTAARPFIEKKQLLQRLYTELNELHTNS